MAALAAFGLLLAANAPSTMAATSQGICRASWVMSREMWRCVTWLIS